MERNAAGNGVAKYWKNGVPVTLSDGTKNEEAIGIVVSGTDIYAAGTEYVTGNQRVKYWKNGTAVYLTDGTLSAGALSFFVKQ